MITVDAESSMLACIETPAVKWTQMKTKQFLFGDMKVDKQSRIKILNWH